MDLVVKKRKGFVKLALKSGASILPTIGFGENDIISIIKSPWADKFHKVFKKIFGTTAPLFWGNNRGLPSAEPLVTVGTKCLIKLENQ
jgi:hypothetical protein